MLKALIYGILDVLLIPVTYTYALFFRAMRKRNFRNLSLSRKVLFSAGVFPIRDHYYEPLFNPRHLKHSLRAERNLPGLDMNVQEQLELLARFNFNHELEKIPMKRSGQKLEYAYTEGPFLSGDSEILYNMIRHFKPARIIEIGSGYSTLMAINAIKVNKANDPDYLCEHICIEPFENDWLEQTDVVIMREKVEETNHDLYKSLGANDILFIDSSHMIRPQGDVLFEYLEILPQLNSGVIVHIHDIFTPRDYLTEWVVHENRFWNEQYLLEAFLSNNKDFRVIGAANFLRHQHYEAFSAKCPILRKQVESGEEREPGSFWIVRN